MYYCTERDRNQCDYILFTYVTFCIKRPRHTLRSNSKFESAPTVMYCILSSLLQENHKSFQIYFTLVGYLVCGHLQNGCNCKIKESVNRKAACMDSRGGPLQVFLKDSSTQHDVSTCTSPPCCPPPKNHKQ